MMIESKLLIPYFPYLVDSRKRIGNIEVSLRRYRKVIPIKSNYTDPRACGSRVRRRNRP